MPNILNEHIDRLIEAENYYWERGTWVNDKEEERALWCIWSVVEELLKRKKKDAEKVKLIMREKRKIDKNYGREKARKK